MALVLCEIQGVTLHWIDIDSSQQFETRWRWCRTRPGCRLEGVHRVQVFFRCRMYLRWASDLLACITSEVVPKGGAKKHHLRGWILLVPPNLMHLASWRPLQTQRNPGSHRPCASGPSVRDARRYGSGRTSEGLSSSHETVFTTRYKAQRQASKTQEGVSWSYLQSATVPYPHLSLAFTILEIQGPLVPVQ